MRCTNRHLLYLTLLYKSHDIIPFDTHHPVRKINLLLHFVCLIPINLRLNHLISLMQNQHYSLDMSPSYQLHSSSLGSKLNCSTNPFRHTQTVDPLCIVFTD